MKQAFYFGSVLSLPLALLAQDYNPATDYINPANPTGVFKQVEEIKKVAGEQQDAQTRRRNEYLKSWLSLPIDSLVSENQILNLNSSISLLWAQHPLTSFINIYGKDSLRLIVRDFIPVPKTTTEVVIFEDAFYGSPNQVPTDKWKERHCRIDVREGSEHARVFIPSFDSQIKLEAATVLPVVNGDDISLQINLTSSEVPTITCRSHQEKVWNYLYYHWAALGEPTLADWEATAGKVLQWINLNHPLSEAIKNKELTPFVP